MHIKPLIAALGLALAAGASAPAAASSQPYFIDREAGWHFYQAEPEPLEPEVPPPPATGAPANDAGPAPLSAAWLRENMQHYLDRALDDPTPENVELYAYLQRVAMDRAERFAEGMTQASLRNPVLDETARSPSTFYQKMAAGQSISEAKQRLLQRLSNEVGIWYFYSSTCPYCAQQDPVIDRISERHGFSVLNISLDGGPLASGAQQPYVLNDGHAQNLGVMMTPTLVIARPDTGELVNLSAGLRTVGEIEDRLIEVARMQGWITAQEHDEATRGDPRMFVTDGLRTAGVISDDPAEMLQALREASFNGGATPWLVAPSSTNQE
jgi:conjugal transfer pilus assembly protein TraF